MIDSDVALTAAHCVYASTDGGPVVISGLTDKSKTVWLLRKSDAGDDDPRNCYADSGQTCKYDVGNVADVPSTPKNFKWDHGNEVPEPDIAIIKVRFEGRTVSAIADLTPSEVWDSNVTLAGYGRTSASGAYSVAQLLVGWQNAEKIGQYGLKWTPSPEGYGSNACYGDSGGPIFEGDDFGERGETHRLFALVSYLEAPAGSQQTPEVCEKNPGFGIAVAPFIGWICEMVSDKNHACAKLE